MLSLDQLLKKNKQKKSVRDARDAQMDVDIARTSKFKSANVPLGRKRKAPDSPIDLSDEDDLPAPLQHKPPDVLNLLESSEEEDEPAGDESLKQPYLVSAPTKRVPAARKPGRSDSVKNTSSLVSSDTDAQDLVQIDVTSTRAPSTKSTESHLFRTASSDGSETKATTIDGFKRPEEQGGMEEDQPSVEEEGMDQSESVEAYDDDSDMDEWLSSSVVVRAQ